MQVSVIGAGYVGLVTAACLADVGNDVLCIDIDAAKIGRLGRFEIPIHEPGLDRLVERNAAAGRLRYTAPACPSPTPARRNARQETLPHGDTHLRGDRHENSNPDCSCSSCVHCTGSR